MLTLNKYKLNRLDPYCKFKKYEKIRPMSSVFVLSIYITMCHRIYMKRPANDTIPVTDCDTGYIWSALRVTWFLWQSHGNLIQCRPERAMSWAETSMSIELSRSCSWTYARMSSGFDPQWRMASNYILKPCMPWIHTPNSLKSSAIASLSGVSNRGEPSTELIEIGDVFSCTLITSDGVANRRAPVDPAHQISLFTPWKALQL